MFNKSAITVSNSLSIFLKRALHTSRGQLINRQFYFLDSTFAWNFSFVLPRRIGENKFVTFG